MKIMNQICIFCTSLLFFIKMTVCNIVFTLIVVICCLLLSGGMTTTEARGFTCVSSPILRIENLDLSLDSITITTISPVCQAIIINNITAVSTIIFRTRFENNPERYIEITNVDIQQSTSSLSTTNFKGIVFEQVVRSISHLKIENVTQTVDFFNETAIGSITRSGEYDNTSGYTGSSTVEFSSTQDGRDLPDTVQDRFNNVTFRNIFCRVNTQLQYLSLDDNIAVSHYVIKIYDDFWNIPLVIIENINFDHLNLEVANAGHIDFGVFTYFSLLTAGTGDHLRNFDTFIVRNISGQNVTLKTSDGDTRFSIFSVIGQTHSYHFGRISSIFLIEDVNVQQVIDSSSASRTIQSSIVLTTVTGLQFIERAAIRNTVFNMTSLSGGNTFFYFLNVLPYGNTPGTALRDIGLLELDGADVHLNLATPHSGRNVGSSFIRLKNGLSFFANDERQSRNFTINNIQVSGEMKTLNNGNVDFKFLDTWNTGGGIGYVDFIQVSNCDLSLTHTSENSGVRPSSTNQLSFHLLFTGSNGDVKGVTRFDFINNFFNITHQLNGGTASSFSLFKTGFNADPSVASSVTISGVEVINFENNHIIHSVSSKSVPDGGGDLDYGSPVTFGVNLIRAERIDGNESIINNDNHDGTTTNLILISNHKQQLFFSANQGCPSAKMIDVSYIQNFHQVLYSNVSLDVNLLGPNFKCQQPTSTTTNPKPPPTEFILHTATSTANVSRIAFIKGTSVTVAGDESFGSAANTNTVVLESVSISLMKMLNSRVQTVAVENKSHAFQEILMDGVSVSLKNPGLVRWDENQLTLLHASCNLISFINLNITVRNNVRLGAENIGYDAANPLLPISSSSSTTDERSFSFHALLFEGFVDNIQSITIDDVLIDKETRIRCDRVVFAIVHFAQHNSSSEVLNSAPAAYSHHYSITSTTNSSSPSLGFISSPDGLSISNVVMENITIIEQKLLETQKQNKVMITPVSILSVSNISSLFIANNNNNNNIDDGSGSTTTVATTSMTKISIRDCIWHPSTVQSPNSISVSALLQSNPEIYMNNNDTTTIEYSSSRGLEFTGISGLQELIIENVWIVAGKNGLLGRIINSDDNAVEENNNNKADIFVELVHLRASVEFLLSLILKDSIVSTFHQSANTNGVGSLFLGHFLVNDGHFRNGKSILIENCRVNYFMNSSSSSSDDDFTNNATQQQIQPPTAAASTTTSTPVVVVKNLLLSSLFIKNKKSEINISDQIILRNDHMFISDDINSNFNSVKMFNFAGSSSELSIPSISMTDCSLIGKRLRPSLFVVNNNDRNNNNVIINARFRMLILNDDDDDDDGSATTTTTTTTTTNSSSGYIHLYFKNNLMNIGFSDDDQQDGSSSSSSTFSFVSRGITMFLVGGASSSSLKNSFNFVVRNIVVENCSILIENNNNNFPFRQNQLHLLQFNTPVEQSIIPFSSSTSGSTSSSRISISQNSRIHLSGTFAAITTPQSSFSLFLSLAFFRHTVVMSSSTAMTIEDSTIKAENLTFIRDTQNSPTTVRTTSAVVISAITFGIPDDSSSTWSTSDLIITHHHDHDQNDDDGSTTTTKSPSSPSGILSLRNITIDVSFGAFVNAPLLQVYLSVLNIFGKIIEQRNNNNNNQGSSSSSSFLMMMISRNTLQIQMGSSRLNYNNSSSSEDHQHDQQEAAAVDFVNGGLISLMNVASGLHQFEPQIEVENNSLLTAFYNLMHQVATFPRTTLISHDKDHSSNLKRGYRIEDNRIHQTVEMMIIGVKSSSSSFSSTFEYNINLLYSAFSIQNGGTSFLMNRNNVSSLVVYSTTTTTNPTHQQQQQMVTTTSTSSSIVAISIDQLSSTNSNGLLELTSSSSNNNNGMISHDDDETTIIPIIMMSDNIFNLETSTSNCQLKLASIGAIGGHYTNNNIHPPSLLLLFNVEGNKLLSTHHFDSSHDNNNNNNNNQHHHTSLLDIGAIDPGFNLTIANNQIEINVQFLDTTKTLAAINEAIENYLVNHYSLGLGGISGKILRKKIANSSSSGQLLPTSSTITIQNNYLNLTRLSSSSSSNNITLLHRQQHPTGVIQGNENTRFNSVFFEYAENSPLQVRNSDLFVIISSSVEDAEEVTQRKKFKINLTVKENEFHCSKSDDLFSFCPGHHQNDDIINRWAVVLFAAPVYSNNNDHDASSEFAGNISITENVIPSLMSYVGILNFGHAFYHHQPHNNNTNDVFFNITPNGIWPEFSSSSSNPIIWKVVNNYNDDLQNSEWSLCNGIIRRWPIPSITEFYERFSDTIELHNNEYPCPTPPSPSETPSSSFTTSTSHGSKTLSLPTASPSDQDPTISPTFPTQTHSISKSGETSSKTIPLPPPKLISNILSRDTKTAGTVISAVSPGYAMTSRKVISIAALGDCGKIDVPPDEELDDLGPDSNPLQLKFGKERFQSRNGAIVGAGTFMIAWLGLISLIGFLRSRIEDTSVWRGLRKVRVPSTAGIPAFVLLPSVMNSVGSMIKQYDPDNRLDIAMISVGFLLAVVFPLVVLFWLVYEVRKHEVLKEEINNPLCDQNQDSSDGENDNGSGGEKGGDNNDDKHKKKKRTHQKKTNQRDKNKQRRRNNNENNGDDEFDEEEFAERFLREKQDILDPKPHIIFRIFQYLVDPRREYKRSRFNDRWAAIYESVRDPLFIVFQYIIVVIFELTNGIIVVCGKDRDCCRPAVIIILVFAFLDVLITLVFRLPYLVRIELLCVPICSLLTLVMAVVANVQFFGGGSPDENSNSYENDMTQVMEVLTQFVFYLTMVAASLALLAEIVSVTTGLHAVFKNRFCNQEEEEVDNNNNSTQTLEQMIQNSRDLDLEALFGSPDEEMRRSTKMSRRKNGDDDNKTTKRRDEIINNDEDHKKQKRKRKDERKERIIANNKNEQQKQPHHQPHRRRVVVDYFNMENDDELDALLNDPPPQLKNTQCSKNNKSKSIVVAQL